MSPVEEPALPVKLGEFRVLGLLGEGAYGTVYAAERDAAGGAAAPLALKVLRAEILPTERQRKQFLIEATLLAQIDHPGVVKVLGFGLLPDDRPYLAMERLEGESLADRLRRGALPPAEALALFDQLAEALAALHERGLLHRDVKPENVFLRAGEGVRAVLFDFGIAKGADAPASTMTQDGAVRGTPAYMAPERFFGAPSSVASEVYELGVTLYAMLAGRLPWHDAGDPESRLSPKKPSELGVALPPALEAELLRALSTRAENRQPSVRELAARVRLAMAGSDSGGARRTIDLPAAGVPDAPLPSAATASGQVQMPGMPAPTEKLPRRSRVGTAAFALVALGVAGGVGAFVGKLAWKDAGKPGTADAGPPAPIKDEEDPKPPLPPPGPRRPAFTHRVPELVWKHHADDTLFMLAVSWTQVLEAEPVAAALADRADEKPTKLTERWQRACGFDLVTELEWVTIGAGRANDGKDVDLMVGGRWTRDELEGCMRALGKGPFGEAEMRREGAITYFKIGGRALWLGWVDDHTVAMTLRVAGDRPWMAARLAGEHPASASKELQPMRKRVDEAATVWLVARPQSMFPAELSPGIPTPLAISGQLTLGKGIDGELRLGYASAAEATRIAALIQKQLDVLKAEPVNALLLGKSVVKVVGSDVVIEIHVDAKGTEAVVRGSIEALSTQLGAL